jgi:alkanesulfonate monooxygenase SsuD/methylene tetrahydromethanopterin reductase-like flavin-dependent oxidoreductase (luciferase family)
VKVDLLFDPFGATWGELREAAIVAEGEGYDGVWLYDHLAGSVHGRPWVLECWTALTAIAAVVPRVTVGPMVLNAANRDAGTLAVMAATLQEISAGRLMLGLGAGGGRRTPYAAEQRALGRQVPGDARRRADLENVIAKLRQVWTGSVHGVAGFLQPDPAPPIIVGGFGAKMAELAGRVADGVNLPGGPRVTALIDVARSSRRARGLDPASLVVTASSDLSAHSLEVLAGSGVDRAVGYIASPTAEAIRRLAPGAGPSRS